jgi:uroporphyrinogen-III decarboxylase
MVVTDDTAMEKIQHSKEFLLRLWNLKNDDRPGFMIGDVGGMMTGGKPVKSALFSTEGVDTVRERLRDPEKFLNAQLEEIEQQLNLRGDFVPALCPTLGVIGIPSAFGCEVVWWEKDFPAVRSVIGEETQKVFDLPRSSLRDGELGRILDYTKYFIQRTHGTIPIRLTDIQGPLDSAALIFGHSHFLSAMNTDPDAVHHLLDRVTDLTVQFAKAQRDLVIEEGVEFVPTMFQPWMPDGFGISVSNDESVMISAEMHDEYSVPYLNRLSEAFGGIYIHSCGDWTHQCSSLEKVRGLRGLEFGATEAPFETVLDRFNGKILLACRIGLQRERKFNGMAEYVKSIMRHATTCRGLFINVDVTNGIVDNNWPVTNLEEIYLLIESPEAFACSK